MDLSSIPQIVRSSGRFHEVTKVLAKYGLAGWMADVRVDWVQQLFRANDGTQLSDQPIEERIRCALTELGTTFIKLGQILSTRPDLVGPELANELSQLQSGAPADDIEEVRKVFDAEFEHPPEELFQSFESEPLASASIAQIHRAVTLDGRQVVVKVQHRGIQEKIQNDLEIMGELAKLAESLAPQIKKFQPVNTVSEFSRTLLRELDFGREARNLQQFANNFRKDDGICFPTPYSETSSRRILTMEFLEGISLSHKVELEKAGYDLKALAQRGASMFIDMIFRDGFYHADPHPGNLMILPGEVIGVIDCGMVGYIDEELREQVEDMLLAAVDEDSDRLANIVVRLGQVPQDLDRTLLNSDISDFVMDYRSQTLSEFDLSGALNAIISIVRRHNIVLPARIALLLKVLVMLEGTAQQLSPDFSLAELMEPYREEAIRRRLSPIRLFRRLQTTYRDWNHLAEVLPVDLADILSRLKSGRFDIHLDHRRLDSTVNRLVMGIVSAALFVGSATLWSAKVPPVLWDYSLPGAFGCGVAVMLGLRLLYAIRRSGDLH